MSEFNGEKAPGIRRQMAVPPAVDLRIQRTGAAVTNSTRAPMNPAQAERETSESLITEVRKLGRVIERLNTRADRRGRFQNAVISVGLTAVLVLPQSDREYFLLQNSSASQTMYVGIGFVPTVSTGLRVVAGGSYEPLVTPDGDIYVISDAAGASGLLLWA